MFQCIKSCCEKNETSFENMGSTYTHNGYMWVFDTYDIAKTTKRQRELRELVETSQVRTQNMFVLETGIKF